MTTHTFRDRVVGSTGLSIATHLAMESLFWQTVRKYDDKKEIHKVDISKYKYYMFNFYTFLRNVLNSFPHKDKREILLTKGFNNILTDEINMLSVLFEKSDVKVSFYVPNYDVALRHLNKDKDVNLTAARLEHKMLVDADVVVPATVDVKILKNHRVDIPDKTIITTSYGLDILNRGSYSLLESHTGKLKSKSEFFTKYHKVGSLDLSNVPIVEVLMYILGDNGLVKPLGIPIRKRLLDIAKSKNWTYRTTIDKIKHDCKVDTDISNIISVYKNTY